MTLTSCLLFFKNTATTEIYPLSLRDALPIFNLTAGPYTIVSGGPATVTISDNDAVAVSVSGISGNTSENGTTAFFTVVRTPHPTAGANLPLQTPTTAKRKV